jgi:hypothetical protein
MFGIEECFESTRLHVTETSNLDSPTLFPISLSCDTLLLHLNLASVQQDEITLSFINTGNN